MADYPNSYESKHYLDLSTYPCSQSSYTLLNHTDTANSFEKSASAFSNNPVLLRNSYPDELSYHQGYHSGLYLQLTGSERNLPPLVTNGRHSNSAAHRDFLQRNLLPADPYLWTQHHIQIWLNWIIEEQQLKEYVPLHIYGQYNGRELLKMGRKIFTDLVPGCSSSAAIWEQLFLLHKVSQAHSELALRQTERHILESPGCSWDRQKDMLLRKQNTADNKGVICPPYAVTGPIQLWQFLLELLTDRTCQEDICWTGTDWEFKIINPDEIARRWGWRKNKPKMNYEKLSRGLRYYYDKNIIQKAAGKRYVYKYVCDLSNLLGHTSQDFFRVYGLTPQPDSDSE